MLLKLFFEKDENKRNCSGFYSLVDVDLFNTPEGEHVLEILD